MKLEIKCKNPKCDKLFLAWPSAKRKYCCFECSKHHSVGDNNAMKKQENKDKLSKLLKGRDITWGDKISKSLKTSEKAKETQFKTGKDNLFYGKGDRQKGELNPFWKGGKTTKNQLIRNNSKYQVFRKTCMERDGYRCIECGVGGYLQVHHIKELAKYPELAYDIDNGKTVCIACHRKIHGKYINKLKRKNE